MRKLIFILLLSFIILPVNAESWDDFNNLDRMWDGQKSVTNKEFDQVMDALNQNAKKKEEKQRKKLIKKIGGGGTSLHSELNPDKNDIQEIQAPKPKEEGLLINLPVRIIIDDKILDKGFYKVIATKEDGKIYINFYQSQFFKGKIEAYETDDDFGEETVDFARMIPYNSSFVKFIFGSIDFNAYAYAPFVFEN